MVRCLRLRGVSRRVRAGRRPQAAPAPLPAPRVAVLLPVVGDRRLDRVLGEDRAVDLHRRQRELLGDLRVLDRHRLVERLALDPLGDERRRRDRRAAAVGLELGVLDEAVLADLDLQLHHVAAGRRADHAGADVVGVLGERADVARILVVVEYLVAVCHVSSSCVAAGQLPRSLSVPPTAPCSGRCLPGTSPTAARARAACRPCAAAGRPCSRSPPRS